MHISRIAVSAVSFIISSFRVSSSDEQTEQLPRVSWLDRDPHHNPMHIIRDLVKHDIGGEERRGGIPSFITWRQIFIPSSDPRFIPCGASEEEKKYLLTETEEGNSSANLT